MLKVGLTGGLASGKTFVSSCFADLGARVAHADRMGYEVLLPEGEAFEATIEEFGRRILHADGSIDRKALAAIVFADAGKLERLNALVHPHVFARQQVFFEEVQRQDRDAVAIVEAAIMIEVGSYRQYDRIVVAFCPEETQIERFLAREPGATREQALSRMSRQMPLAEKLDYADYVIDTSGSKEGARERTREVFVQLKDEAIER